MGLARGCSRTTRSVGSGRSSCHTFERGGASGRPATPWRTDTLETRSGEVRVCQCGATWTHIYIYTYIYIYSASHCRYFTLLPLWLVAASRIAPTAPNSRRDTHLRDSTYFTFSLSFSFTCTLIYIDRFKIKEKDESLINKKK